MDSTCVSLTYGDPQMPMFPTFPQPFPSALDQDGADPQLPSDSPLARLSRMILSGQLPEEMRPHVARVLQGIRQDIANQANASAYGGFASPFTSPADYPQSSPVWGSLAPPSSNDDEPEGATIRTVLGHPGAGRSPVGDSQGNDPSQGNNGFTPNPDVIQQSATRGQNMPHCLPLYVRCQDLHGNKSLLNGKRCGDCLNMCLLNGYWPFQFCPM